MFSISCIERIIAREQPENLIFADVKRLRKIAQDPTTEICIPIIAELARRFILNPQHDPVLEEAIGNTACTILANLVQARLLCSNCMIPDQLWQNQTQFSQRTERFIREKILEVFCKTDGYIPVYYRNEKQNNTEKAFFIPFHLEPSEQTLVVCDLDGVCHDEWTLYLQQLSKADGSCYRCVLHIKFSPQLAKIDGNSCMLPLLLAILRKQNRIVPYHPERLIATGALNNGGLAPVDVTAKYHAFQDSFSDAVFCCPQSEPPLSQSYNVQILPLGINTDEITRKITKCIEAKGLFIPSLKYAIKRLPEIENDVRSTNYNNWNVLTDVISNLEKGLDPNRSPEQYLIMQMLKSAAACHHGNTDEAIKFNRNAYTFAKENGFARETFRLDIELLIELLDKEDFLSFRGLAATLEQQLKEVDDTDLFMRYYGTMGQVQAYGTLAKFEGFSNQNALFCFQNALKYAFKSNSEQDIAQDQNYIHLWHVLFHPGEQAEIETFQNALRHIQCNLADQPENQFRNLCYLERQRAFAIYRHLLMYEKLPDATTFPILLTDRPDDWLEALLGKYNGAAAAAKKDYVSARNMFDHALQVINLEHSMAIKAFIRMTICAEAYRSLQDESYLAEGLRSFELFREIRNYATAARWEAYLRNPGENSFPGIEYWY